MNSQKLQKMLKASGGQWFRCEAGKADRPDRLDIVGVIGGSWFGDGVSLGQFLAAAKALKGNELEVHISSPGGSVSDGLAIYNYLVGLSAKGVRVTTCIDGLAASIASVIAMAGDVIRIGQASSMLIHRPWAGACGNAGELENVAKDLAKIGDQLARIYADRSGLDMDSVLDIMAGTSDADGTLLTAQDAVANGLADEIIPNKLAAAACVGAEIYGLETSDDPDEAMEDESSDAPDGAMEDRPEETEADEPEDVPEEAPEEETEADEPEDVPEEAPEEETEADEPEEEIQSLRQELAELRAQRDSLLRSALAPAAAAPASPRTWQDAVAQFGYEEARRRFPRLYAELIKKFNA